jgi:capsular exopolysaccharide synthesis family protein
MSPTQQPLAPYLLRRAIGKRRLPEPPPSTDVGMVQELWAVVVRRWRWIAATVGTLVTLTAAYCLVATPIYKAKATVLIESRAPQVLHGERVGFEDAQDPFTSGKYDYYQTQFRLLQSPVLAKRVIGELGLATDPRFVKPEKLAARKADGAAAPAPPGLTSKYLLNLKILPIRGTRLVSVEFRSPDPKLAAEVANAHARAFVRAGLERLYGATEQIQEFLQAKLAELQTRMQEAETKLIKFQSEHSLLPIDLSKDVESERLKEVSKHLTEVEAERIAREAEYRVVQGGSYDSLPVVLSNDLIQKLRENYNALEVEHALMAGKFRSTYPRLRQLAGQLEHARRLLERETEKVVKSVEARYLAAENEVQRLEAELEAERTKILDRKDVESQALTLMREAETNRSLYDHLLARVKDLDVVAGANTSNISVAETASAPRLPTSPATRLNLFLSVVTGLLLGTGLAFLRDSWDGTIQDANDIRRVTGLGTLAVIPDFEKRAAGTLPEELRWRAADARRLALRGWQRVTALTSRNGKAARPEAAAALGSPALVLGRAEVKPSAEAYRTLRTSLLLHPAATSPRVILVTSAASTEGKTTTAINTAAALASCGVSVLLIDGDLRLPRCHESLGLGVEPGLSEYLAGDVEAQPIQPTRVENLFFLGAGRLAPNATELLTSWRMWKLMQDVRERFGFIVIDSPPLLAVSDGMLLANLSDGVIVVAERGRSRREAVRTVMQRLNQIGALPLGAVLNRGSVERDHYRYVGVPGGSVGNGGLRADS